MNSTVRWLLWPGVVVNELMNASSCELFPGGFVAPESSSNSVFELAFHVLGPIFYEAKQDTAAGVVEGCLQGYSANLTVTDSPCFDSILNGNETTIGEW